MTLFDVSRKMMTVNFKKYRLYFLCNVFSVMLFYCFAAIFTNKFFMDPNIVDSMISSNIIAPSVFVGIFLVLFVPYSYSAFTKDRKHEYGILMSLGMSEREVLKNMLFENCVIAGLSLFCGLILGTALSFFFYFIIGNVIGITELRWYLNADSYKWTAALYGATILVTLVCGILGFLKTRVTDLIKEKFRAEKKAMARPGIFLLGAVFSVASVIVMVGASGAYASSLRLCSLGLMIIGLLLMMTHPETAEQFLFKVFQSDKKRHLLERSFLKQHSRSRGRTSVIAACLIGFSVFFAGLCAVLSPNMLENAIRRSPYDLVYSITFGKNRVSDGEVRQILSQNGVSVKALKQVEYLREQSYNLLPATAADKAFHCGYRIPEGSYLSVFQYDPKDGYEHQPAALRPIFFQCKNENVELKPAGSDIRILFNDNPVFGEKTLILNDSDYAKLAMECGDCWKGTMKLYSFDNWKNSKKATEAIQQFLLKRNQVDRTEQDRYYKATSKIETYTTSRQSNEFLIFLMFFIFILFCCSADIMIHFKIKSESEEEHRMLSGLFRIGVTSNEMLGMISQKNIYYYMPQVLIGALLGAFYNYRITEFCGLGWTAAGYSLLIGAALAALQYCVSVKYSKRELLSFI